MKKKLLPLQCRYITFLLACLLVSIPIGGWAEDNNPGIWIGAEVEKKLSKKWTVGMDAEYRGMQGLGKTDRMSIGVSGEYKPWKFLKIGAGYEYLHSREQGDYSSSGKYYNSSYWYPRHRVNISVMGQIKLGKRIGLSLRERWMYTNTPEFDRNRLCVLPSAEGYGEVSTKTIGEKNRSVLRSRLMIDYNIRKCPVSPFLSAEMFNGWEIQKMRYSVGADWKISKHHKVSLYYIYQDFYNDNDTDDDKTNHIAGVQYSFSF